MKATTLQWVVLAMCGSAAGVLGGAAWGAISIENERHGPSTVSMFASEHEEGSDASVRRMLAGELMRAALDAAATSPLTSDALALACLLAERAATLDPESKGIWRMTLTLATLAERDALRKQAIDQISRLDPADDAIRLLRLNLAIERSQTVDERMQAYERLLDQDQIRQLGDATASRLAFDYALLHQRMGDVDGFGRWLTRSLELDRSNRTAAALAAGFFQSHVTDALGQAELLVNLVMADPTDIPTQVSLAEHLLEHGAYGASKRMYELARNGLRASRMPADTELMADIAIAQWAAGDVNGALATIDRRQAEIDEYFRAEQARSNRSLTMVQIGELHGPVHPTLAAVTAVIHTGRNAELAKAALDRVMQASQTAIDEAAKAGDAHPDDLAAQHLEAAWLALWLGDEGGRAERHIAAAEALSPLSDAAKTRFAGWNAINAGELERAIELLAPLSNEDAAARVGLAIALERSGLARDAASHLLELNRQQPGTMMGIWASEQLTRILGRRLPLSKQAADLERLISSLPSAFDRYSRDAAMTATLRLNYPNANPSSYEPLLATLELTNVSSIPLAIDPRGPLRPQILIVPTINTAVPFDFAARAFVIDLDSRLRLMPRETASVTFDLRWYSVGEAINALASTGAIVRMVVTSNFIASGDGAVVPGLFGSEIESPLMRINGMPQDLPQMEAMLATLNDPQALQHDLMHAVAMFANALRLATVAPPENARMVLLDQARAALPLAFGRLEDDRQAWVLSVMHSPAPSPALLDVARKSESPLTRLAYLLFHLASTSDPMIDAARRSDDATLRQVAEAMASGVKLRTGLNAIERRR